MNMQYYDHCKSVFFYHSVTEREYDYHVKCKALLYSTYLATWLGLTFGEQTERKMYEIQILL